MKHLNCTMGGDDCKNRMQWAITVVDARTQVTLYAEYVCENHMRDMDTYFDDEDLYQVTYEYMG